MASSPQNVTSLSAAAFACALCCCVGLQTRSSSNVDQGVASSLTLGTEPPNLIDVCHPSFVVGSSPFGCEGDSDDMTNDNNAPKSGMAQLKTGLVWLYQLVVALIAQVAVIASDIIALKNRITVVEGIRTPVSVHNHTEALIRQIEALSERLADQDGRITDMELSHKAEAESHRKTIVELKLDNVRIDEEKQKVDGELGSLRESIRLLQYSMDCQSARVTGVKADTARKIALLQSDVATIQGELVAVKMVALPVDVSAAAQAAKEARKARILASVAQRMDDSEMAKEIETLCPLPVVIERNSGRGASSEEMSVPLTSSSGPGITLATHRESTVKKLDITKERPSTAPLNAVRPGANRVPPKPTIPLPPTPVKRAIPTRGSGKENKMCDSSTKTTKLSRPGVGRTPDVRRKLNAASPKRVQLGAGLPSKKSALPKPRKSMVQAPRKLLLPTSNAAKHVGIVDGSPSNKVETAGCSLGGFETRTVQHSMASISKSQTSLESSASSLVENVLVASSSVDLEAVLDVTLDENGQLTYPPNFNCLDYDPSLSAIPAVQEIVKSKCDASKLKLSKSRLKSGRGKLTENEINLTASSSLAALDVALHARQGDSNILALSPGPKHRNIMDLSFSRTTPMTVSRGKHSGLFMSPPQTFQRL